LKVIYSVLLFLATFQILGQPGHGHLVIAGGGLVPGNKSAYNQLISLAGGPEKACFAIIPTASGTPVQSFGFARDVLVSYGVKPGNIFMISVSVTDDDQTTDVDESKWADNGNDPQLAATIGKCSGVWFTGGDQMRVTKALYEADGSQTLVLKAVWDVYKNGGVIGGTSAGAALMSEVMIGNGSSLGALQLGIIHDNGPDNDETDALLISRGCGFFPEGIIDQHFTARARIGRLAVALLNSRDRYSMAYGVDENTVLIYSAYDRDILVAGAGGVTILNASSAELIQHGTLPEIRDLSVSYIGDGDKYDIPAGKIIPAAGKRETAGHEYYNRPDPGQGGLLSPNSNTFLEVIGINLIDNKAVQSVSNLTFTGNKTGYLLTFTKKPTSMGYYMEGPDEEDLYTISDIRLDIVPVEININTIQ
jgi:cyanophycinase